METAFLICAVVGGSIFLIQLVMQLIGLGDWDHDIGADGHDDSSAFFGLLSIRSIVAAIAFFGLSGLAAQAADLPDLTALGVAAAAGFFSMWVVAVTMRAISQLRAEGTVEIANTIGLSAQVYLRIPPNQTGAGKVTVEIQGRTTEFLAKTTNQTELPTGSHVTIVRVLDGETVEVVPAGQTGGTV